MTKKEKKKKEEVNVCMQEQAVKSLSSKVVHNPSATNAITA